MADFRKARDRDPIGPPLPEPPAEPSDPVLAALIRQSRVLIRQSTRLLAESRRHDPPNG